MPDADGDQPSVVKGAIRTTLEQLVPGARASGVVGDHAVDVVSVKWFGANFVELTYRHDHGGTG